MTVNNSGAFSNSPAIKISHLTGDYYIFTTYKLLNGNPFPANGMYVVTDSGVVMIDAP